nr:dynamin-2A-like [Ipomoea batatas]
MCLFLFLFEQPTGEGGATRAPICVELKRDSSLSSKLIILQIDSKSQEVSASALRRSLQERLSKISSKSRDEIYLKLKTSTGMARHIIPIIVNPLERFLCLGSLVNLMANITFEECCSLNVM